MFWFCIAFFLLWPRIVTRPSSYSSAVKELIFNYVYLIVVWSYESGYIISHPAHISFIYID